MVHHRPVPVLLHQVFGTEYHWLFVIHIFSFAAKEQKKPHFRINGSISVEVTTVQIIDQYQASGAGLLTKALPGN
jgi:hypothetical protein